MNPLTKIITKDKRALYLWRHSGIEIELYGRNKSWKIHNIFGTIFVNNVTVLHNQNFFSTQPKK